MQDDFYISLNDLLKALTPIGILALMIGWGAQIHTSTSVYFPKHYRISSSPNLTGKGIDHQCFPYARELQVQLYFEAQLLSSLIFFNWRDSEGDIGSHVVVHYWDRNGYQWLADNQKPNPISVYGSHPEEWIARMYPGLQIEVVPNLVHTL